MLENLKSQIELVNCEVNFVKYKFTICKRSTFHNKSTIQETSPMLSTDYNGQIVYEDQTLQKNYEE